MKKTLLMLSALSVIASAHYETYKMKTKNIGPVVSSEVVFFGDPDDFADNMEEITKAMASKAGTEVMNGLSAGAKNLASAIGGDMLSGGLTGLGIGIVIGALDGPIMKLHADQKWLHITKITDAKGNIAYEKRFIVCDKNPSLNKEEAAKIIQGVK